MVDMLENAHIQSQTHHGKKFNGFLARNDARGLKQSPGTANLVLEHRLILQKQGLARLLFLLNDLTDQSIDILNDVQFTVP